MNHGHPTGNTERLSNKTNQQISCCQTTIQEFGRRMEGRFLVKGNKDRELLRNVVMERRMLTDAKDAGWSPPTFTDMVLTWCPNYSREVQTCIISSHEELEIKISSWRFYLVLEKLDWRQSANTSNNSNLYFGHRCKRIFKCLSRFVKMCFFISVLFCVYGLILKTKP